MSDDKDTLNIKTVRDLANLYGGGVIRNDRGQGAGGPGYIDEDDIRSDDETGLVAIERVTRDEDPDAWGLAADAAKALGLPQVTIVCVGKPDHGPGEYYIGNPTQIIYAV